MSWPESRIPGVSKVHLARREAVVHASRLTGSRWRKLRLAVLERDGWRCQRCGSPGALEAHHRDGNPGNNAILNLEAVCRPCHIDLHRPPVAPEVAAWRALIDST